MINIKGRDKAEVLMRLYNASKPLGMGFLHYIPKDMTLAEAQATLSSGDWLSHEGRVYFDYLHGRVMKVDLSGDEFDPTLYDRDNGEGAAQNALGHWNK